jgi:hypothetical protein
MCLGRDVPFQRGRNEIERRLKEYCIRAAYELVVLRRFLCRGESLRR